MLLRFTYHLALVTLVPGVRAVCAKSGSGPAAVPAPVWRRLDLFATGGIVDPGSATSQDRFFIGGRLVPDATGRFSITGRTAGLVQSIWLLGRH
jgi:hypothetical protein